MYGLCDCNNFFVSCERVFNPSLQGRAVVVLSNNDGCIIARSEEAKALGIKMGQPFFQAQETIRRHRVAVYSSNYLLYNDMSQRVMDTIKQLAPAVEIYSVDEAFLHLDGMALESLSDYGRSVARTVRQHTGIPVSLGIAPTKTLAKVASKLCKKYPKLQGCCLMYRPQDITKVLSTYPIGDVWGIGRRYGKMLKAAGIETAEQFRQRSAEWVRQRMSIVGLRTWRELHGEPCIGFDHRVMAKQSICVSRSFTKEIVAIEPLREVLSNFVSMAAEKLRRQKSIAGQMQIFICTNRFSTEGPQQHEGRLFCFPVHTDSTPEMVGRAMQLLQELFRSGYGYKRAGVILYDIVPQSHRTQLLFDEIDRPKHLTLMQSVDRINHALGRNCIRLGIQGACAIPINRELLSPQYTTDWDDILVVKV